MLYLSKIYFLLLKTILIFLRHLDNEYIYMLLH